MSYEIFQLQLTSPLQLNQSSDLSELTELKGKGNKVELLIPGSSLGDYLLAQQPKIGKTSYESMFDTCQESTYSVQHAAQNPGANLS